MIMKKPRVNSRWRHTRGGIYYIRGYANEHSKKPSEYPVMVIYESSDGKVWCRPFIGWFNSFIQEDK